MKKRFLRLYESWLTRYNHGGFLQGDIVKFKSDALKHPFVKTQADDLVQNLKDLIDGGLTLRVTNVINKFPAVMGTGNPDDSGPDFTVEVGEDVGGGRIIKHAIVHVGMLDKIDTTPGLEEVPDKNKYDNKVKIKPVEVKDEAEEVPFYSPARTRTSDRGNQKLAPTEASLKNVNIKIPAGKNFIDADPAAYTAKYMPKA
jgi:hypothetical protein